MVGKSSRTRFIESAVSEGLELLLGGLGAAVPRFRQTGNRSSKIARELWRGAPGSFMGYAPTRGAEDAPLHIGPPGPAGPAADGPPGNRDGPTDIPAARDRRRGVFP